MKNSRKYRTESKKRYRKLNWENKKKRRKAEQLAAAAAAATAEIAIPAVNLEDEANNTVPAVNLEVNGANNAVPAVNLEENGANDTVPAVNLEENGANNTVPAVNLEENGASNAVNLQRRGANNTVPAVNLEDEANNTVPAVNLEVNGANNAVPAAILLENGAYNAVPAVNLERGGANTTINQEPAGAPAATTPGTILIKERRKTMKWSIEEGEILKELLMKHTGSFKETGPWEIILLEGKHVFKRRTGGDLKNKWERMLPHWLKEEEEARNQENQV
ncbi:hypothetical protein MKW92_006014 [Papaver armeniacum]|nr:hypothetical protein MKW92_006014 [Papaver armeniacum]